MRSPILNLLLLASSAVAAPVFIGTGDKAIYLADFDAKTGKAPRHFKIDPSGKWMLIGHQDSNTISVLAIDSEKGTLGEPSAPVSTPKPICILFAK